MFFLMRVAFWLSIVIMLLPTGKTETPGQATQFSAFDAMSAAGATIGDLREFCGRQPGACEVGSQAAVALGHKAQASAKMLYEFLTERLEQKDNTATGSVTARYPTAAVPLPVAGPRRLRNARTHATHSQHTLTPADLVPPWRGPHKEARFRQPT